MNRGARDGSWWESVLAHALSTRQGRKERGGTPKCFQLESTLFQLPEMATVADAGSDG